MIFDNNAKGKIVTFYSYKGGTGRTMALANMAVLLSKNRKKKVLMIDWDLEAPGLHRYFEKEPDVNTDKKGLIEFFIHYQGIFAEKIQKDKAAIRSFLDTYFDDFISIENKYDLDNIHFMRAGNLENGTYSKNIATFDWKAFYKKHHIFYSVWVDYLNERYDYTLIDSRTGLTDTGGVCTMLLPDRLVLVFTYNDQSLQGTKRISENAIDFRKKSGDVRPLLIYPLASRVDISDTGDDDFKNWRTKIQEVFENIFKKIYDLKECDLQEYFDKLSIAHSSTYSRGEKIAAINDARFIGSPDFNIYRYNEFVDVLESDKDAWDVYNQRLTRNIIKNTIEWNSEKYPMPDLPEIYSTETDSNRKYQILKNTAFQEYIIKKYNITIPLYHKCLEEKNDDEEVYFNLGYAYFQLEEYKNAIEAFKEAVKVEQDDHVAWTNLALSYHNLLEYDKAIPFYEKAISIKRDYAEAWFNLGNTYNEIQKYDLAIDANKKAIEFKKDYHQAWVNIGITYNRKKEYNKAITSYQNAIEVKRDFFEAWYNLGISYHTIKEYDKAIIAYNQAIEIKDDNYEVWNNLGCSLEEAMEYNKAIIAYQRAINIKNDGIEAWENISNLYEILGQYIKAIDAYQHIIEIDSSDPEAWYNLAGVYHKSSEYDKAISAYKKAIELKKDYYEATSNFGIMIAEAKKEEINKEARKPIEKGLGEIFKVFGQSEQQKIGLSKIHEAFDQSEQQNINVPTPTTPNPIRRKSKG